MIDQKVELPDQLRRKWTAVYLPAREPGQADPSRYAFVNEAEALDLSGRSSKDS